MKPCPECNAPMEVMTLVSHYADPQDYYGCGEMESEALCCTQCDYTEDDESDEDR